MTVKQSQSPDPVENTQDKITELKKVAIIAGQRVALPMDARFYFQDKRGLWFWSARKPRIKEGDWSNNKQPVQIDNEQGHKRCLKTNVGNLTWEDSLMQAVKLDTPPLMTSPELDDLSSA